MNTTVSRALLVIITLVTAGVHLFLGVRNIPSPFGVMFVLNAIGFLGLLGLYLLPIGFVAPYRAIVRWVLIAYSALTFILYFAFNGLSLDLVSGITKAAELGLIAVLWLDRPRKA
jgi:hypothetical protein